MSKQSSAAPPDPLTTTRTLFRLVRVLEERLRTVEGTDGLTVADLSVLGGIERGSNLPSVLARVLRLDPGRVTRISDRLYALKCIERESDERDRRLCRLSLTEVGRERLAAGRRSLAAGMSEIAEGLSLEERSGLEAGLEGIRRLIEERPEGE